MLLINTRQEVIDVMGKMVSYTGPKLKDLLGLETELAILLEYGYESADFLRIGELLTMTIPTSKLEDFPDFLLQKHQDYGVEPLLISRVPGMLDRMLHKLVRIKNLTQRPGTQEHITQELLDILGYSVLAYQFIELGL